jgi:hypothetical protein
MMLTSCESFKYKSSVHGLVQIASKEGVKALFRGCTLPIYTSVIGGGMLACYDVLKGFISTQL